MVDGSRVPQHDNPAWYVVSAHREYRVRDDLQEQGFDVWLPECKVVASRRRVRITKNGALFPGYLFVLTAMDAEARRRIEDVRWVDGLLLCGEIPWPVPCRVMATLRQLVEDAGGRVLIEAGRVKRGYGSPPGTQCFEAGEALRILDGPFIGFRALYVAADGRERVKILLDILGRPSVVSVSEASVEAA